MTNLELNEIAELIDEMLKQTLSDKVYPYGATNKMGNKVASGRLRNSIKTTITQTNGDFMIDIMVNDYFDWVQSGRAKGKKPVPYDDLLEWVRTRRIKFNFSQEQKYLSFAYAINKKRKREGKKPIPMNVLINWMKNNNIQPNFDAEKATVYTIRNSIKKKGIKNADIEDKFYKKLQNDPTIINLIGESTFNDFLEKLQYTFIDTKIT